MLTIPPQPATWILDREQIDGADFTMGEQPVRLERVAEIGVLHAEQRAAAGLRGEDEREGLPWAEVDRARLEAAPNEDRRRIDERTSAVGGGRRVVELEGIELRGR